MSQQVLRTPTIVPSLWFDTEALDAARFYTEVFPDSRILNVASYTEAGPREAGSVLSVEWEIAGQRFDGINGGPEFRFTEAISFQILCKSQEEVDHYWERLSDGGEEGQCGWLKDRFGVSWQVIPRRLTELLADDDPTRSERVMSALLKMRKLDIAALERAAEGVPAA
jgi:predicted 3-demethylubiquinone-9 3-methyltransferase (glyoxalase superfamily)